MKELKLIKNAAGGIDLMVERDAGNLIRILTGYPENSVAFFEALRDKADQALEALESLKNKL